MMTEAQKRVVEALARAAYESLRAEPGTVPEPPPPPPAVPEAERAA